MAAPGAIEDLTASVVGKTSTTLTWTNPADTDSVILRRAEGAEAPETSSDGEAVTVTGAVETVEDSGLDPDTQYSYAAWAVNAGSEESETAATLTVVTLPNTSPHNATSYSNPAWSSPAETAANNAQRTLALQADFDRSEESSKEQYQLLTELQVGPDPAITAFLPANGWVTAVSEEFSLDVIGTDFQDGAVVLIDGVEHAATFVDSTTLTVTVDTLDEVTTVEVVVVNGSRSQSPAVDFEFLEIPEPAITSLTPDTAVAGAGPITVTVAGTDFLPDAEVYWNSGETPLATVTVNSATELEVEVPDEVAGDYDLVVDNGESKVSTAAVFTYTSE
jgi:hypothetical protein